MTNPNPSKTITAGDILAGKYRVERLLGAGSAGVVVAATHLDLEETRAIKLLRPDFSDRQSIERFLREARALSKLRSEHVVKVHDVGRLESGTPYIVMEKLDGDDLATILETRGPLAVTEVTLYVAQACLALGEAHGLGIVHRDLKPANLFLTRRADGSPCIKVLDFGISKQMFRGGDEGDVEMTHPGDVMGSPLYMAPEQMRSARRADARSDIWSFGAILYKLLTGKTPFQAPTVPEIFAATLAPLPAARASTLRPDIPAGLDDVLAQCLEKDPTGRYASVEELRHALLPFVESAGETESAPSTIRMDHADDAPAFVQTSILPPPARRPQGPSNLDTVPLRAPEMQGIQAAQLVRQREKRAAFPSQTDGAYGTTVRGTHFMPPGPSNRPSSVPQPPSQPSAPLPSFRLSPPPMPGSAPVLPARKNASAAVILSPEQVVAAVSLTNATMLRQAKDRRRRVVIATAGATAVLLLVGLLAMLTRRAPDQRSVLDRGPLSERFAYLLAPISGMESSPAAWDERSPSKAPQASNRATTAGAAQGSRAGSGKNSVLPRQNPPPR